MPDLQYTQGQGGCIVSCTYINAGSPIHSIVMRERRSECFNSCTRAMVFCKRLSYTIATMRQAVEVVEQLSKEAVARQLQVDTKRVYKWCRKQIFLGWTSRSKGFVV